MNGGVPETEDQTYLKKTANLGELVQKLQRPWYVKPVIPDINSDTTQKVPEISNENYKKLD